MTIAQNRNFCRNICFTFHFLKCVRKLKNTSAYYIYVFLIFLNQCMRCFMRVWI